MSLSTAQRYAIVILATDPDPRKRRTFAEIGRMFGVTRERVRQLVAATGVDTKALNLERVRAQSVIYNPDLRPMKPCTVCSKDYQEGRYDAHLRKAKHPRMDTLEWAAKRAAIAQDYAAGMLIREIIAKHGVNAPAVNRARREAGIPLRRPGGFLHGRESIRERQVAIRTGLDSGEQGKVIAARHGVSESYVSKVKIRGLGR